MQQYSQFFVSGKTKTVDLGDGQWVEIKTELGVGDWEQIDAAMLQMVAESNGGANRQERRRLSRGKGNPEQVTNLKIRGGTTEVLSVLIVSWSFQEVPINPDTIRKLKEPQSEKILAAFDEEEWESPLVPASGEESI